MITLFQSKPAWGIPNISPFCVKLETYLRMAGHPYKTAPGNPMKAPKGKIPYVQIDGKILGDSSLIIDYLKKHYGDPLDSWLTPEQKAHSLAIQRMVEEHLYFAGAWLRWNTPDSWKCVEEYFLGLLPPILGRFILKKLRKDFLLSLYNQGIGRHSSEEIVQMAKDDYSALSLLLGNKPFFLGDRPSGLDAIVYGFLIQVLHVPWEGEIKQYVRSFPNLMDFDKRMKEKYWADV